MSYTALPLSPIEINSRPSAPYGKPPEHDLRRKSGCRQGQSSEQIQIISCDPLRPSIHRLMVLSKNETNLLERARRDGCARPRLTLQYGLPLSLVSFRRGLHVFREGGAQLHDLPTHGRGKSRE